MKVSIPGIHQPTVAVNVRGSCADGSRLVQSSGSTIASTGNAIQSKLDQSTLSCNHFPQRAFIQADNCLVRVTQKLLSYLCARTHNYLTARKCDASIRNGINVKSAKADAPNDRRGSALRLLPRGADSSTLEPLQTSLQPFAQWRHS